MLAVLHTRKRKFLALFLSFLIFLLVKWSRMTVPEKAERLAILDVLAANPPRAYFPPLKEGCPSELPDGRLPSRIACAGFPEDDAARVQVVLKTGASEQAKAKKALSTFLACLPDVLVVSDAEDTLNGRRVVDVLADLPVSYATDNPDWEAYEAQKAIIAEGDDVKKSRGGWRLDRFKFLPMVEKAYEVNPHADWYIFIEDDIYVFWDSFHRLVSLLDPSQRHFLGTAVPGANHTFFGYGGGGTILSRGLLHDLLDGRQQRLSDKYEALAKTDCCGDAILAYAIYEELGMRIENAFPSLSGEALNALGASEGTWCTPLTTLHRVPIEKVESLWQWERCRPFSEEPITLATVLSYQLSPLLQTNSTLEHWDNFSGQPVPFWKKYGVRSAAACREHCTSDRHCLQWSFANGQCRTAPKAKKGKSVDHAMISGWDLEKMKALGFRLDGDGSEVCSHHRDLRVEYEPDVG